MYIVVPDRDPLQDSIIYLSSQSLIPLVKVAILDNFWGDPGPLFDITYKSVTTYFEYFECQCRLALYNWEKYNLLSLKFHHVTDVVKMMQHGSSRLSIESYLSETLEGNARELASEVVDLVVRLRWMVPIWNFWQGVSPGETTLTWHDGAVKGAFARHFKGRTSIPQGIKSEYAICEEVVGDVKLERAFTARSIEEVMGLRVVWTSNLLDHLQIRAEERTVAIFHHAAFLHYQSASDIYPEGLIEETLRTLSLLLPAQDAFVQDWYLRHQLQLRLDPEASRCHQLSKDQRTIENFKFWRERLVILKQAYDKARPPQYKKVIRRCFSILQIRT